MITRAGSTWGAAAAKRVPPTSSTTTPPTAMTALLGTAENHPAASASTRGRPRAIRKEHAPRDQAPQRAEDAVCQQRDSGDIGRVMCGIGQAYRGLGR